MVILKITLFKKKKSKQCTSKDPKSPCFNFPSVLCLPRGNANLYGFFHQAQLLPLLFCFYDHLAQQNSSRKLAECDFCVILVGPYNGLTRRGFWIFFSYGLTLSLILLPLLSALSKVRKPVSSVYLTNQRSDQKCKFFWEIITNGFSPFPTALFHWLLGVILKAISDPSIQNTSFVVVASKGTLAAWLSNMLQDARSQMQRSAVAPHFYSVLAE